MQPDAPLREVVSFSALQAELDACFHTQQDVYAAGGEARHASTRMHTHDCQTQDWMLMHT